MEEQDKSLNFSHPAKDSYLILSQAVHMRTCIVINTLSLQEIQQSTNEYILG